jgi:hypothetical protein
MLFRVLPAAALVLATFIVQPAFAEAAAEMAPFTEACKGAAMYLLPDAPEGTDTAPVMAPLCDCIVKGFAQFPQGEIDVLAADLRGESTEDTHKAFGDYQALSTKAGAVVQACFADPAVVAAKTAAGATPAPAPAAK